MCGRYTTRQILDDIPGLVAVDNSSLNVGSDPAYTVGGNINLFTVNYSDPRTYGALLSVRF